jgi:hypothetical protein
MKYGVKKDALISNKNFLGIQELSEYKYMEGIEEIKFHSMATKELEKALR